MSSSAFWSMFFWAMFFWAMFPYCYGIGAVFERARRARIPFSESLGTGIISPWAVYTIYRDRWNA